MRKLFLTDAYLREAPATVTSIDEEGAITLDACLFYATSGGQPGDRGELVWEGGTLAIGTAVKGDGDTIRLIPEEQTPMPAVGTSVRQVIDWDLRLRHMRMHTALHLLSVVIPLPVSGGQIGAEKSRLDFDMPEAPEDKQALEDQLNALITADHPVSARWIDEADLDETLVKTMSVAPPKGAGRIRLVQIGAGDSVIDLQPCGGTHVARTSEVGRVRLGKIEKKGRQNRRVSIHLEDV
ncbi:MAG: alanyl-tRNA editing protein [Shimia sp.]